MNQSRKIQFIARVGILAALACALTFFPKIPIGKGYIHIGDSIIYIASILMGPAAGMFVGAIGHSLADIISGFPEFCIPTLIIKALLGYAVGMLLYKKQTAYRFIISAIVSYNCYRRIFYS